MSTNSLESRLQILTTKKDCADCCALWEQYRTMKDYLRKNYYPWVQASCPWFTDHGEKHVASVRSVSDQLLEPALRNNDASLNCLGIYLYLCAIIWHDVGMVSSRSGHAKEAEVHIQKVRELCFPDPSMFRLVSQIVHAHSDNDRDDVLLGLSTQEDLTPPCAKHTQTVLPQALAAVLRYADEISENHTRVGAAIIGSVPSPSRIYWDYATAISATKPEPERQRTVVTVELQRVDAAKKYECPKKCAMHADGEGKITFIEYLVCRLEKMNRERLYCFPYFTRYATMHTIEVRMKVCNGTDCKSYTFDLHDGGLKKGGYPETSIFGDFFARFPELEPTAISRETAHG